MNVKALNYEADTLRLDGSFEMPEAFEAQGLDSQAETIHRLRSIIRLSMHCLESILKRGHIQGVFDRDSQIQDDDPYIKSLMDMIKKGTTGR
jgi:hypothetical protein